MGARRREWLVRAALVLGAPLVFLLLVEGGLRLARFGYPTNFFLRTKDGWGTNEKFGWRLFPPGIARTPAPEVIQEPKTKRRVFVLGESAAMGFPDPALGLPAFLQSSLGQDWQVVNAAMTAIHSHVVREIARECARLRPDGFVVYMGNNEVVGPFGVGSVFGNFSPALGLIRAQLWIRTWRVGQLLSGLLVREPPPDEWRGLEFFRERRVPASDPRLVQVYSHFRENLLAIIRAGQEAGARVVVSTVAVNLRDCPPFAGSEAMQAYGRGEYVQARDLDELRFRADSRINEIIRDAAGSTGAVLVDAEKVIEPNSQNFWEHVHLRPEANRRLADFVARAVTSDARSAALEVTAWDRQRLAREMLALTQRPPFTASHRAMVAPPSELVDHRRALDVWRQRSELAAQERLAELQAEIGDYRATESIYRALLARLPWRSWHTGLGEALLKQGRTAEAERAYRAALALDGRFAPALVGVGIARAAQNDPSGAEEALRRAISMQPGLAEAHNGLGQVLQAQGKPAEAAEAYRHAVERKPGFAIARYNLAGVLARLGRLEQAIGELQRVISDQPDFAAAHYDLGLLLAQRGDLAAATVRYAEAVRLNPNNADALNNWGTALARQGRTREAREKFESALKVDSGHRAARRNLELLEQQRD
jgi:tetratricopeptide (TPR) repeat protein